MLQEGRVLGNARRAGDVTDVSAPRAEAEGGAPVRSRLEQHVQHLLQLLQGPDLLAHVSSTVQDVDVPSGLGPPDWLLLHLYGHSPPSRVLEKLPRRVLKEPPLGRDHRATIVGRPAEEGRVDRLRLLRLGPGSTKIFAFILVFRWPLGGDGTRRDDVGDAD